MLAWKNVATSDVWGGACKQGTQDAEDDANTQRPHTSDEKGSHTKQYLQHEENHNTDSTLKDVC